MKVLIIGDSWGAGHNADTNLDDGWVGFECVNLAVDGSTAAMWVKDREGWLTNAVKESSDADVVIVSLLGNDAFSAFGDGIITPEELAAGHACLRKVVEAFAGKRVIVMLYTAPLMPDVRITFALAFLNGAIRMAVYGLPVEFADTQDWLTPDKVAGMPPHPTTAGWAVIRGKMRMLIGVEV